MQGALRVRTLAALALCLGIVSSSADARADWALIAIKGADARTRTIVRSRAEVMLRKAGHDILATKSAEAVSATGQDIQRCVDQSLGQSAGQSPACLKSVLAAAEVDWLLYFELEPVPRQARALSIELRLYHGRTGKLVRAAERSCAPCQDEEALRRTLPREIDELTASVLELSQLAVETWIEITTEPPTVSVRIDGKEVGPSGRAYHVSPGAHTIRVELEGHEATEQTVEARSGATTPIHITLVRRVDLAPSSSRYGAWKWAALGSGVGLAALGVIAMAIDGPRFDDNGQRQPDEWNTMGQGIASTLLGAGLLGVSGYMFYKDSAETGTSGLGPGARGSGASVSFTRSF